jgi:esterase/lipase
MSKQEFILKQIVKANQVLQFLSPTLSARFSINLFCSPQLKRKKNARVNEVFKDSHLSQIIVNNLQVQVYEFGITNEKKILLVHGWQGHGADFYRMIPVLIDSGYHVITFDGPAHGLSDGKTTNMIEFAEVINCISNKFNNNFETIIAHSFGGGASLVSLTTFPDINIKNIITIASPDRISKIFEDFFKLMKVNDRTQNRFLEILESRTGRKVNDLNLSNLFSQLNIKKLIIHDKTDQIVSFNEAKNIKLKNTDVKFMETSGLGHVKILHSKDVHEEILEFIKI